MSERTEIESGMATLMAGLVSTGKLKSVKAVGGFDYETMLRSMVVQAPCALIKYLGKSGEPTGGGLVHYTAEISVLIIVKSWKTIDKQREHVYDVLNTIESALSGKRLGTQDVYWPLWLVAEQWSEITGNGVEVWEHRWQIQWDEIPA